MMLLQAVVDSTSRAPDASIWFWGASQVVVTFVIFVGVYYIFKPVFGKKDEPKSEDKKD